LGRGGRQLVDTDRHRHRQRDKETQDWSKGQIRKKQETDTMWKQIDTYVHTKVAEHREQLQKRVQESVQRDNRGWTGPNKSDIQRLHVYIYAHRHRQRDRLTDCGRGTEGDGRQMRQARICGSCMDRPKDEQACERE